MASLALSFLFNPFEPGTPSQCLSVDYDENILAFRTIVSDFLQTPLGSHMREIILKDTQITTEAINLISNPGNVKTLNLYSSFTSMSSSVQKSSLTFFYCSRVFLGIGESLSMRGA